MWKCPDKNNKDQPVPQHGSFRCGFIPFGSASHGRRIAQLQCDPGDGHLLSAAGNVCRGASRHPILDNEANSDTIQSNTVFTVVRTTCPGGGTGRRKGLKIPRPQGCTSSILVPGIAFTCGRQKSAAFRPAAARAGRAGQLRGATLPARRPRFPAGPGQ
jgi:hypothetical protein